MPFNIVQTTAEDIIGVVDAILAKPSKCSKEYICDFSDISITQVDNALIMAKEMNLIADSASGTFISNSHLARLIVSSRNSNSRAALLRLVLEQYEPYIAFKARFLSSGSLDTSAKQIKAIFGMSSTYKEIKNTIINIATYTKSMSNDGAGTYIINEDEVTYIDIVDLSVKFKSNDASALQMQIGVDAYEYINKESVYLPLLDAYSKIQTDDTELKPIILYAGNAFESFLQQVADQNHISLVGKNGINQKADALAAVISKKHRGMINYIAQIRNAADHGTDPDEDSKTWNISTDTALLYPIVVASIIKDIFHYMNGRILV